MLVTILLIETSESRRYSELLDREMVIVAVSTTPALTPMPLE